MKYFPRWIIILDVVAAFVLVATALVATYWAVVPVRTFEVSKIEVLNTDQQVRPGQPLIYKAQYCKYVALQAQTVKQLIGEGAVYPLPTSYGNVPKGCGSVISRTTLIPVGVADGTYSIELSITYQVNPLRQETVHFKTPTFRVVGGADVDAVSATAEMEQVDEVTVSSGNAVATRTAARTSVGTPTREAVMGADAADQTPMPVDDLPTPLPMTPTPSLVGRTLTNIIDLLP